MTPAHDLLQFFAYEHLRPEFQTVSKPFGDLARWIVETLPANGQRDAALQALLTAKDCAVRAKVHNADPTNLYNRDAVRALADQLLQYQRDGGRVVL